MYQLRPYQQTAVDRAVAFFKSSLSDGQNAIEVLPTGSGKSLIIANIALALGEPVLIFQPSKEILEQNYSKCASYGLVPCSIYSASCGQKKLNFITFATIGSVIRHLNILRGYKYVIIDECHAVNSLGGMYKEMIDTLRCKVLGLTATPYRLANNSWGSVLRFITRTKPKIFDRVIYAVQVRELLNQGYLAKMDYYSLNMISVNNLRLNSTGADFTDDSVKEEYARSNYYDSLESIIHRLRKAGRHRILVFCRFVEEAQYLARSIRSAAIVTGETDKRTRERILKDFKAGKIEVVSNVGVLTTGFDYPELDTIVMARPTRSLSMWYQICGRAIRPFKDKRSWIVDLCGTYKIFGKVEDLELREGKPNAWAVWNSAENKQLTNVYF